MQELLDYLDARIAELKEKTDRLLQTEPEKSRLTELLGRQAELERLRGLVLRGEVA